MRPIYITEIRGPVPVGASLWLLPPSALCPDDKKRTKEVDWGKSHRKELHFRPTPIPPAGCLPQPCPVSVAPHGGEEANGRLTPPLVRVEAIEPEPVLAFPCPSPHLRPRDLRGQLV